MSAKRESATSRSGDLEENVRAAARDGEPDRYLAALLAPPEARDGLLALAAFAAETARIAVQVREPIMGEIRLQWWRDAISASGRGEPTGNPVADALTAAITRHGLPLAPFETLLDARGEELTRDFPPDDAALDRHLADTEGTLFSLGLAVVSSRERPAGTDALVHAASVCYGLARGLGRLPLALRYGGIVLSLERLEQAGISPGMLAADPIAPETAAAIDNIARGLEVRARAALDEVRHGFPDLGTAGVAAFLPLAMVEPYFSAQNRRGYRRLEMVAELAPLTRAWRLWRASRRRRF
jgi:15-cis-phytoene synthase